MILVELVTPGRFVKPDTFVKVDEWIPSEEDRYFKHCKGAIIVDTVSRFYGVEPGPIDMFQLNSKRAYNSLELREHLCQYINYFIKFYDQDKELLSIYYKMKYLIDYVPTYNVDALLYDIKRYILNSNIRFKFINMNLQNYDLNLTYKNKKNPGLQYNNVHGKILLEISLLMNAMIPLLTHFIEVKRIQNSNDFLMRVYDILLHLYDNVDIYNKLYETAESNISRSGQNHAMLWGMQEIRGINITTHSLNSVKNIILNYIGAA